MHIGRFSWIIFLAISLLLTGPGSLASESLNNHSKPPQRVILRVNRNLEVAGTIELEDEEVIVVRDRKGELQSFSKNTVGQIIRLVDPAPDQVGIVVLLNGQTQEGIIIEDSFDQVVITINSIRSPFRREYVDYVLLEPSFEDRYRIYKQSLTPTMHEQYYQLAHWLFQREHYELAKMELQELLKRTEHNQARRLLTIVEAQLKLISREKPRNNGGEAENPSPQIDSSDETHQSGLIGGSELLPDRILTPEEVNIIRVMEIDFSRPPKIRISPDTVRSLIENYRTDRRIPISPNGQTRFFRLAAERPLEVLRLMFQLKARDMYQDVEVITEPHALNLFRQRVHNAWLINNCASRQCHGGLNAGGFFLHRKSYKKETVRYTNFLILDRLVVDEDWPLINYEEPGNSLLIQYALRRDLARKPHPDVDGWKAVFTKGNSRLLQDSILWIQSMMSQPRPVYPVEFEPPVIRAPTEQDKTAFPNSSGRPSR